MNQQSTASDLLYSLLKSAGGTPRIYLASGPAEPTFLADIFTQNPDLADGATFVGHWLPGINRTAWAGIHPNARAEGAFLYKEHRESYDAGRFRLLPLHYSLAYDWLKTVPLDAAFIPVTPPDVKGEVSLSLASDMSPALVDRTDIRRIALIRPAMPAPVAGPRIPLSAFSDTIEDETALITLADPPLSEDAIAIASHVASLLGDGFTVQSGVGSVQQMAMQAAAKHQNIRIHTGMVSGALMDALKSGAISDAPGAITTGTAIGEQDLYDQVAADPRFRFEPVTITHSVSYMAGIPHLATINGGIEVDLFGQLNSEWVNGRQVASTGGLGNFARAAQLSPGGRSIIALPATARGGKISRITAQLSTPTVTLGRADAGFVVTEYGIADLATADIDQRAERLIAIAAPEFQIQLANDWARIRAAI